MPRRSRLSTLRVGRRFLPRLGRRVWPLATVALGRVDHSSSGNRGVWGERRNQQGEAKYGPSLWSAGGDAPVL